jgi:2,3-bisphosphoglycerate-dependent phosphoglycerate mutase
MKKILVLFFVIILAFAAEAQQPITTFILVRHAEKGNDGTNDPELAAAGVERAKKLVDIFSATNIDAFYSTKTKRTQNTIAPLAQAKGKEILIYDNQKPATVDELIAKNLGKTIFVVGHSNTVPQLANQLLGKEQFQNFADTDYGNIIVISIVEKAKTASYTLLRY